MRYYAVIVLIALPIMLKAQQNQDDLWGSKKLRFGISLQAIPSYWKQKNLNNTLADNDLPKAGNISNSIALGDIMQWNKFRISMLLTAMLNKNSSGNDYLQQQFGGLEINGEYFVVRKKSLSLSPLIGGGLLYGTTRIRSNSIPASFPDALSSRNTTELFNRQGYLNIAFNLGFDYSPRYRDHIYQAVVGYRLGFANTKWSTDPKKEVLSAAPADALRQLYLGFKVNFLFTNRK